VGGAASGFLGRDGFGRVGAAAAVAELVFAAEAAATTLGAGASLGEA
jgi:hypothetical protein